MTTAHIIVTPKRNVLDPQGEAVKNALKTLGLEKVKNVRVGKFIELELNVSNNAGLREKLTSACHDLLSNPVIEDYQLTFDQVEVTPPQADYEGLNDSDEEAEEELVKLESRPKKAAKKLKKIRKKAVKQEKPKKDKEKKKRKKKEKIKVKDKETKKPKNKEIKDLSETRTRKKSI